ncbi:hypothetical protein [Nonomuraea aridisoli]|uniref:DUF5655 domain-containing protein n=1 Tax=Nonomuraea aridisoli TaxID=2070368 RepID=A0A2W2CXN2_9ACTN|nr:hypothetical protein [Nonomuraea aridisoli]PZG04502.1 hypothetical protein C1J01_44555 [Nonomuraea aridisoli]
MDSWTVERHLDGKSAEVVGLYHRFIELAEGCGPFGYAVSKSAIVLKGTRRGFAGVVPGATGLKGFFDLRREVSDRRISRCDPYTKRLFVAQWSVSSAGDLDDEFAGWLREAYAVGQGAHLQGPPLR